MNLGGVIALKIGIRNRMIELECYIASQFLYELWTNRDPRIELEYGYKVRDVQTSQGRNWVGIWLQNKRCTNISG